MRIQIRGLAGEIRNQEVDVVGMVQALSRHDVGRISFDLMDARLILRPDGTYQILGGLVNYPSLG